MDNNVEGWWAKAAGVALVALLGLSAGCASSPTGRSQLILFPESQMAEMGSLAYQQMRAEGKVSTDPAANQFVNCVANALIAANPALAAINWEISVFNDDVANAFALPGGKLGVYRGMLTVATNQHQLAAVVGHELAHVIAQHGNERVSTQFATNTALQVGAIAAGGTSPMKQQLFGLLGLGAQVGVILPFGRAQETEADVVGLEYMARAGFEASEAAQLWRNMSAQSDGGGPPAFLSTHPKSATRIERLEAELPNVLPLQREARLNGRDPKCQLKR